MTLHLTNGASNLPSNRAVSHRNVLHINYQELEETTQQECTIQNARMNTHLCSKLLDFTRPATFTLKTVNKARRYQNAGPMQGKPLVKTRAFHLEAWLTIVCSKTNAQLIHQRCERYIIGCLWGHPKGCFCNQSCSSGFERY